VAHASRHALVYGWSCLDLNHDAIMRIGSEAPGRRAHSTGRSKHHVQTRVAATSDRGLQFIRFALRNRKNSCWELLVHVLSPGREDYALRNFAGGDEPPQRNEQLAGERDNHDVALLACGSARLKPLCERTVLLVP
jgi:hypothetical protein